MLGTDGKFAFPLGSLVLGIYLGLSVIGLAARDEVATLTRPSYFAEICGELVRQVAEVTALDRGESEHVTGFSSPADFWHSAFGGAIHEATQQLEAEPNPDVFLVLAQERDSGIYRLLRAEGNLAINRNQFSRILAVFEREQRGAKPYVPVRDLILGGGGPEARVFVHSDGGATIFVGYLNIERVDSPKLNSVQVSVAHVHLGRMFAARDANVAVLVGMSADDYGHSLAIAFPGVDLKASSAPRFRLAKDGNLIWRGRISSFKRPT